MGDDIDEIFKQASSECLNASLEYDNKESGWSILEISFVLINVFTYQLKGVGSYISTPKELVKKNALVNIINKKDDKCLMYCVSHHFFKSEINELDYSEPEVYVNYFDQFNVSGITFPCTPKDVSKFARLNSSFEISFNIYSFNNNKFEVISLTKIEKKNHIDLLLVEKKNKFHCPCSLEVR